MPRLTVERQEERRRQFIDAAWRCAADRGFRDLTIDDVCAEAQASKGAFYVYFDTKLQLLMALLDDDSDELEDIMDELDGTVDTAIERLRRFTRAMIRRSSDPALVQVRADLWSTVLSEPRVRSGLAAAVDRRRAILRGWIDDAVSDGELVDIPGNAIASVLIALWDGLLVHGALNPSGFRWANVGRAIDALLEGLVARDD